MNEIPKGRVFGRAHALHRGEAAHQDFPQRALVNEVPLFLSLARVVVAAVDTKVKGWVHMYVDEPWEHGCMAQIVDDRIGRVAERGANADDLSVLYQDSCVVEYVAFAVDDRPSLDDFRLDLPMHPAIEGSCVRRLLGCVAGKRIFLRPCSGGEQAGEDGETSDSSSAPCGFHRGNIKPAHRIARRCVKPQVMVRRNIVVHAEYCCWHSQAHSIESQSRHAFRCCGTGSGCMGLLRRKQNDMAESSYKAFVSYSHQSDERLACSLQSSLTTFAKPWYRLRSMRIFQDKASLSASPGLWTSIEQALSQSEFFLLLACPTSAESRWVQQELHWWIQNRTVDKLILCLTDGDILWDNDARDFNWQKTNAISPNMKGIFPAEPLYADFRAARAAGRWSDSDLQYRAALLDIAAPLLGRPKDELDGDDIRLHRRAKRIAWGVAAVVMLLAVMAAASFNAARQRQKIAASRALASEAVSHVADRSLALLLSIESRRIADTVESRRALLASIQRLPGDEAFLWGHSDAVSQAVLSPDGKTVMSAGWDNRIVFWSIATHQPVGLPVSADKGLVSVAFNAAGSRFASASRGSVAVWDTSSRRPAGRPFRADEQFVHVGFSPSGKLVAASADAYGAHPSTVYVWDIESRELTGKPIPGSTFAFSPDESFLAVGQFENVVLFNLKTRHVIHGAMKGLTKNIHSIAFNRDGTLVAAGSEDGSVAVWDVQKGDLLGKSSGGTAAVDSLVFDGAGELLFSGSQDGTITAWDVETFKAVNTPMKNLRASISSMVLQPNGALWALGLERDRVILFDLKGDPPLGRRIQAPDSSGSNIAFSPDGRWLASSGEFGDVVLWDVATGRQNGEPFSGHERQVSSLVFSPDGTQLISGAMDGTVIFWNTSTRQPLAAPDQAFHAPVWSIAVSPDGKTLAAGSDAHIAFWDLATHKPFRSPIASQKDRIWNLAFSPSGTVLASAGNNRIVDLWSIRQPPTLMRTLGRSAGEEDFEIMPVGEAFSPDGRLLASSTEKRSITLWNSKTGQALAPLLYGHKEAVQSLAFRSDGKVLVSGSADGEIRVWDVEALELLGVLDGGQGKAVNSVSFEKHGNLLASVDAGNVVTLWDIDFGSWEHLACQIANRNLSQAEWNTYLAGTAYRKTCVDL